MVGAFASGGQRCRTGGKIDMFCIVPPLGADAILKMLQIFLLIKQFLLEVNII